jgi:hypothetical protein
MDKKKYVRVDPFTGFPEKDVKEDVPTTSTAGVAATGDDPTVVMKKKKKKLYDGRTSIAKKFVQRILKQREARRVSEEVELDEKVKQPRQLINPSKEVMVVKNNKVIVVDKKDLKQYTSKGWSLAEEVELEEMKKVEIKLNRGNVDRDIQKIVNHINLINKKSRPNQRIKITQNMSDDSVTLDGGKNVDIGREVADIKNFIGFKSAKVVEEITEGTMSSGIFNRNPEVSNKSGYELTKFFKKKPNAKQAYDFVDTHIPDDELGDDIAALAGELDDAPGRLDDFPYKKQKKAYSKIDPRSVILNRLADFTNDRTAMLLVKTLMNMGVKPIKLGTGRAGKGEYDPIKMKINPSKIDAILKKFGVSDPNQITFKEEPMMNEKKLAGFLAFYGGKKVEIPLNKVKDINQAKQIAIKMMNVPKSKQGLLAIQPAYEHTVKEETMEITEEVMTLKTKDSVMGLKVFNGAKGLGLKAALLGKYVRVKGSKKQVNDFGRTVIGKSSMGSPTELNPPQLDQIPQEDRMLNKRLKEELEIQTTFTASILEKVNDFGNEHELVETNLKVLQNIVKRKQNQKVKFKDKQATVDLFTANAIMKVYDAVKPDNKKKIEKLMNGTITDFLKLQKFAMKQVKFA